MKNKCRLVIFLFLFVVFNVKAQVAVPDSVRSKVMLKKMLVPSALIGAGILINKSRFEKNIQRKMVGASGNSFRSGIDDYLRIVPVAEMYLADLAGIKNQHHWFDQTKYLFISNIFTTGITTGLKHWFPKTRPDGSPYSFPSGHATLAFTNATVLYNEFHESSLILAYSGFIFAGTTATIRMLKDKHWLSDVLVGAGIGIGVTQLVYYFEPLRNFNPFKKEPDIILVPQIDQQNIGFYFSWKF